MTGDSEEWFGDLTAEDGHAEIEAWEQADEAMAANGTPYETRRAFWRSLDPDGAVLDWYEQLCRDGMGDEEARELIKAFT